MSRKPTGALLVDAERAAEIEVALGAAPCRRERNFERGRDRLQGDAGAGDQRLEQHVARAEAAAVAAGRRVQPGLDHRPAGLDLAGDALAAELALGL